MNNFKGIKIFAILAAVIITIIAGIRVYSKILLAGSNDFPHPYVATVNGEEIEVGEMEMVMMKFRTETVAYFYNKYNLDYSANFWETEVDGITPLEYIKQKSLNYIADRKLQQKFIQDQGLIGDFSYQTFVGDFNAENARREEVLNQDGVIYGVKSFDKIAYYEYMFINQVQMLLDKKGEELFPINEKDVQQYYEKNIERFKIPDEISVDVIMVPYEVDKAYDKIMEAQSALEEGIPFEEVMKNFNPEREPLYWKISEESLRYFDGNFEQIAMNLQVNDISDIFEWQPGWFIIRCTERITDQYKGIEGREYSIRAECIREKYNALIDKMKKDMKILTNELAYNQLTME